MSLAAFAVRLITVRALREKTLAGANVFDSPQNPIDVVAKGITIAVYTGEIKTTVEGRGLVRGDQDIDLSIHMHMPVKVETGAGEFDGRKAAEPLFDILWRQCEAALFLDTGPWAQLWSRFVNTISNAESRPFLIETDQGARYQARETVFTANTISDPAFGVVPASGPWRDLITAMRLDSGLVPLADMLEGAIIGAAGLSDWQVLMAMMGYTIEDMQFLGLAPLVLDDQPPISVAQFTVDDTDDAPLAVNSATPDPGQIPP